jgi:hypothetical protein
MAGEGVGQSAGSPVKVPNGGARDPALRLQPVPDSLHLE